MRATTFAVLALTLTTHDTRSQPEPKPKPDPEVILGWWSIVGLEAGGKAGPEKNYRGNTFTFTKDKATLQERGYPPVEFIYALDATKTPKTIDLTPAKGGTTPLKGIYKLEGDDLVLCLSLGAMRPTEFATKAGGEAETFTLRRIPWERYTDKAAGFGVDLPGKPEERVRKADTPAGQVTTTFQVVRHDPDRATYLVAVTPLPGKLTGKEADAAMQAAQQALVAEVDKSARATAEESKFKPPAWAAAGKELTISLEVPDAKDKVSLRVRLFVAGDRLYALAAAGGEEGVRSPNVNKFWNSFRLPEDKKDPPRK